MLLQNSLNSIPSDLSLYDQKRKKPLLKTVSVVQYRLLYYNRRKNTMLYYYKLNKQIINFIYLKERRGRILHFVFAFTFYSQRIFL